MTEQQATIESVKLADLTLDQLVQLQQGLGRKVDAIREQRAYLNHVIGARIAAGERTGGSAASSAGDAVAPGSVINVAAG